MYSRLQKFSFFSEGSIAPIAQPQDFSVSGRGALKQRAIVHLQDLPSHTIYSVPRNGSRFDVAEFGYEFCRSNPPVVVAPLTG
ncbi:hypothetical protein QUA27_15175 [Microcoleus sp. Pol14C6]|uniref:hypothetical protein n=1 Tax=unclassified Microcoleus TaxID=2642155 RepID=UPI002FD5C362